MTKPRDLATLGGGFTQSGTGAVQRSVENKLNVTEPYRPAGDRYGVKYDALLAFIIAAL